MQPKLPYPRRNRVAPVSGKSCERRKTTSKVRPVRKNPRAEARPQSR